VKAANGGINGVAKYVKAKWQWRISESRNGVAASAVAKTNGVAWQSAAA
jgi:hypothetical protein